jgi:hypothetical protein
MKKHTWPFYNEFLQGSRQVAYHIFNDEYCKLSGVTEEEKRSWYVPAAARSIASGAIPDEQIAKLAAMCIYKIILLLLVQKVWKTLSS